MDEENKNEGQDPKEDIKEENEGGAVDVVSEIAEDLSEGGQKEEESEVANPVKPAPFDFSKLSKEELQSLKAQLAVTPESVKRTVEKPLARLRNVDGKIIIDIKDAFNALVEDHENQRKVFRHLIPVKFYGEEKYSNMSYNEFINAEQKEFEIISDRKEKEEKVVGIVFSAERGREIEAVEVKTHRWFSIEIEEGKVIELPAYMQNA